MTIILNVMIVRESLSNVLGVRCASMSELENHMKYYHSNLGG